MRVDKELFKNPAPTFDNPFEMLVACHGRIKDQCATLIKLAQHLPTHGADQQARQAAENIMRYFDIAGPHHHDDEEKDLFPALEINSPTSEQSSVGELIAQLLRDHREMELAWTNLRVKLVSVRDGDTAPISPEEAQHFAQLYESHIAREETCLPPLATRLLSAEQLLSIGQSMSDRRGMKNGFDHLS